MTRTTLDLDPSVLKDLRRQAAKTGKSMGTVASELLAQALRKSAKTPRRNGWISRPLGAPLVDLEDDEAVRSVLGQDR